MTFKNDYLGTFLYLHPDFLLAVLHTVALMCSSHTLAPVRLSLLAPGGCLDGGDWREGGREGRREGGREGSRESGKEGGRERGKEEGQGDLAVTISLAGRYWGCSLTSQPFSSLAPTTCSTSVLGMSLNLPPSHALVWDTRLDLPSEELATTCRFRGGDLPKPKAATIAARTTENFITQIY